MAAASSIRGYVENKLFSPTFQIGYQININFPNQIENSDYHMVVKTGLRVYTLCNRCTVHGIHLYNYIDGIVLITLYHFTEGAVNARNKT
jgi:hypothetical protein